MGYVEKIQWHRNIKFSRNVVVVILAASLSSLFGCSHTEKILVPPPIDLSAHRTVGVINFSTNADLQLAELVTQNFIQTVQAAQPGVRFIELGSKENVLTTVSRKQLDLEAIKSIGLTRHVDALIYGDFKVSEPRPNVTLSSKRGAMHAGAVIENLLIAKLWETQSGATLWTNSATRTEPLASIHADIRGNIRFGASDPEERLGQMIPEMVYDMTADFRPYYVYRKVK